MLTTADAAKILGVTDSRVRQLIMQDKITPVRLGKRTVLIDEAELRRYIRETTETPKGRRRSVKNPPKTRDQTP